MNFLDFRQQLVETMSEGIGSLVSCENKDDINTWWAILERRINLEIGNYEDSNP